MLSQDIRFAIVSKNHEAGIFYQTDYTEAARPAWNEAFPIADRELGEDVFKLTTTNFQDYLAARRAVEAELVNYPRGSWAVVTYTRDSGHVEQCGFMSSGAGKAFCGTYSKAVDFQGLASRMVEMEIYDTRMEFERMRREAAANDCLQHAGWRVGTKLRNVRISAETYSSVLITKIYDTGYVEMIGTKRGSPKRWTISVLAQGITLLDREDAAAA